MIAFMYSGRADDSLPSRIFSFFSSAILVSCIATAKRINGSSLVSNSKAVLFIQARRLVWSVSSVNAYKASTLASKASKLSVMLNALSNTLFLCCCLT